MRVEQGVGGRRCRCSHGSMLVPATRGVCRQRRRRPPAATGRATGQDGGHGHGHHRARPTTQPLTRGRHFGPVGVIGAGAMGAGIAQVAATAGHGVEARRRGARRCGRAPSRGSAAPSTRLVDKGRLAADEARRGAGADHPGGVPPRPARVRARHRGRARGPRPQAADLRRARRPPAVDHGARDEHLEHRHRRHRRRRRPTRSACSACTSSTRRPSWRSSRSCTASAPRRPTSSTPPRSCAPGARRRCGAARRRASSSTASRGPSTARRSGSSRAGVADAATVDWILRERGGFPMGPLELTDFIGQDVNLAVGTSVWEQTGRDERYTPTDLPAGPRRGGPARPQVGLGASTRMPPTARSTRAEPDVELAERLVGGPVATDPLARTLAMLVNEAVDLVARGEASRRRRRHRDAARDALPARARSSGAARSASTSSAGRSPSSTRPIPGGRYRPSPALTDGSLT